MRMIVVPVTQMIMVITMNKMNDSGSVIEEQ